MTDASDLAALRAADRRLQAAQLAADADALDRLIDDRLRFTGPDGRMYTKQDDLALQRSGEQALTEVTEEGLDALVAGDTGVTWFRGRLAGRLRGEAFTAHVRYTRTWIRSGPDWRLLAAHVSPAD
ncbi:nuclear transport factor 2 family protein [Pilimelia anulata]|uniref:nuclear transport factor 2 family protein n=1 Tax=Pilimelia anulata TaxID=53371 RepID=UPI00166EBEFB|nr:nuclear transport factor 2 family protein [Pilimelia anulata]